MEETYQKKKLELEKDDDPLDSEDEFVDDAFQQETIFKDLAVGTDEAMTLFDRAVDTKEYTFIKIFQFNNASRCCSVGN